MTANTLILITHFLRQKRATHTLAVHKNCFQNYSTFFSRTAINHLFFLRSWFLAGLLAVSGGPDRQRDGQVRLTSGRCRSVCHPRGSTTQVLAHPVTRPRALTHTCSAACVVKYRLLCNCSGKLLWYWLRAWRYWGTSRVLTRT